MTFSKVVEAKEKLYKEKISCLKFMAKDEDEMDSMNEDQLDDDDLIYDF